VFSYYRDGRKKVTDWKDLIHDSKERLSANDRPVVGNSVVRIWRDNRLPHTLSRTQTDIWDALPASSEEVMEQEDDLAPVPDSRGGSGGSARDGEEALVSELEELEESDDEEVGEKSEDFDSEDAEGEQSADVEDEESEGELIDREDEW
jgi:hypothetical protein